MAVFVTDTVGVVLSMLVIVLAYFRESREYSGHSDCVGQSDAVLSEKWCSLCYWILGGQGGILAGLVLSLLDGGLGGLVTLVGSVVLLIGAVLKLVYLHKTSVLFKNYLKNIENST